MHKVVRSVTLFLDYMLAHKDQRNTRELFDNFAKRLSSGTFDKHCQDPSGLCWQPRSTNVRGNIITDLSLFFDWLGAENPTAATINPEIAGNPYDRLWSEAAWAHRREHALLGHLWAKHDHYGTKSRRVGKLQSIVTRPVNPPAFPEDRFHDLIHDGFRVGGRIDYRCILITLLLHGAGFRESEPFHLYVEDVVANPRNAHSALVRIHHPSSGFAPPGWEGSSRGAKRPNRKEYLNTVYGLKPRSDMNDERHAGWKGGLLDAPNYMEAHWFTPEYGELFWTYWKLYLRQLAMHEREHPYAFVNLGREPLGAMFKMGNFNDLHAAACRRIGLVVAKDLGTTPHGHRHAYGQRLKKAGVEPEYIRIFMHHTSLESQDIYTQPTSAEVETALRNAAQLMSNQSLWNSNRLALTETR